MNDFERRLADQVEQATPPSPPPYDGVLARLRQRRARRRAVVASVSAAALVAAVIGGVAALQPDPDSSAPPAAGETSTPPTEPTESPEPTTGASTIPDVAPEWDENSVAPPVVLQLDGRQVELKPWTACYDTGCYDGMPQPPYKDAGDRHSVPFSFPLKGWTFDATFRPAGGNHCSRQISLPVETTGTYTFLVPEIGPPGAYEVELFGRGDGGDVVTTFAWTTTAQGLMPEPDGYLGIVGGNDDELFGYSPELMLNDLARTPQKASAAITVTAGNGKSTTLPALSPGPRCFSEGAVFFRGPDALGQQVLDIGPPPYAYSAEITLDGKKHTATGTWPADEIEGSEPYVALTFDPPLPHWKG